MHSSAVAYPWEHNEGENDHERIDGNKRNVAAYFAATSIPVLQIAAGPNTASGALPEDILLWSGNTRLWTKSLELDLTIYTAGKQFGEVLVINPRNPTVVGDYLWVFTVAKSVIAPATIVSVVGSTANQPG